MKTLSEGWQLIHALNGTFCLSPPSLVCTHLAGLIVRRVELSLSPPSSQSGYNRGHDNIQVRTEVSVELETSLSTDQNLGSQTISTLSLGLYLIEFIPRGQIRLMSQYSADRDSRVTIYSVSYI